MSTSSVDKLYVDANSLLNDAFQLGKAVLASGFQPTLVIALWRGGTPVGIAIQELLGYHGIAHEHYPLKTHHYAGIAERREQVVIEGLEPLLKKIHDASRVLIVDDVFDTGLTLDHLVTEIHTRTALPRKQLRVACVWFKPAHNLTDWQPDYFVHTTDNWIVFPHEIQGLTRQELAEGKPELTALATL